MAAGVVAKLISMTYIAGMLIALAANFVVRVVVKKRGDEQERRIEEAARERQFPEQFTDYEG